MDLGKHWDSIFATKATDEVSWYRPRLDTSLDLIEVVAPDRSAAIIDIGAGASTLIDDLLQRGYTNLTALDISETAISVLKSRLGSAAAQVSWVVGDVRDADLPADSFDVWHDRAVFHFLTTPQQRAAYVAKATMSLKRGGHVILAAFGPEGPDRCSGLPTVHHDAGSLQSEFGRDFSFVRSAIEMHRTPSGSSQQFIYAVLRKL